MPFIGLFFQEFYMIPQNLFSGFSSSYLTIIKKYDVQNIRHVDL